MKNSDKLIGLVEQAASVINLLSPTDLSELEKLQAVLDQINHTITDISDGPAQLLEQAKGTTSDATEVLHKILQQEVEDTARSIEAVSQAVSALQSLVDQVTQDIPAPDSTLQGPAQPDEQGSAPTVETAPREIIVSEEDVPLVLDFISEAKEHLESAETGLLELENKPDDTEVLNQIFRAFHTIKGMAGFLNLTDIGSLAHSAENLLDLVRKGELVMSGENTDLVFESIDMMKKMIAGLTESIEAGKPVPVHKHLPQLLAKLKAAAEGAAVSQKDSKMEFQGQSLAASLDTPEGQKKDEELDEILAAKDEPETKDIAAKAKIPSGDEKIKVSTTRLDSLINMAGELVIAQLMVAEEVNTTLASKRELAHKVVHQGKITRELQELSMSMRMVPIHGVFQKMARLVRDLSRKAGKNINFTTSGEETELDRSIVDKIADPLVHMVRNSVDHGIEPPEERTKAGKNPDGQIKLHAFHQSGNIVIEIEDDGKGLDKKRILKKAIDNGLVEAGQELSDEEIFKLVFHAGLSTAQKITSVSGRGVGMDVVKKNVELLRGKIDISSRPGKGTTFAIRMPLTLAIIDGQIIRIGNDRYIIPINSIVRSLKPTAEQLSSVQTRGEMLMVHGELIPLVRLYKLFGVVPATEDPTESSVVIVEEDGKKCCLLVDELQGQQQVVIKSLGDGLGRVQGVSGGSIMGDGRVSLILDIPGLMQLARN